MLLLNAVLGERHNVTFALCHGHVCRLSLCICDVRAPYTYTVELIARGIAQLFFNAHFVCYIFNLFVFHLQVDVVDPLLLNGLKQQLCKILTHYKPTPLATLVYF